jgi:hypothetical protein
MTMQRIFRIVCTLVLVVFFAGCGGGKVPLKGTVTFEDDGSPLTQGTVAFLKGGLISTGTIQSDGTFTVGTEKATDGLPPGTYQVYITGAEKVISTTEDGTNTYEPQIAKKHENPDTSQLTVEIDASTKPLSIKVERFKK